MKKALIILSLIVCTQFAHAQTIKIILVDSTRLVTIEMKDIIKSYFTPAGVESADNLDYTKRCEYYIATFKRNGSDFDMSIKDCERKIVGQRTIYDEIKLTGKEGMSKALASEIIAIFKADSSLAKQLKGDGTQQVLINHHDSRHFFAPTAYNLKKGELYFSTYYGLVSEIQYGLSDNFSIGGGTSIALIPIFITPKFSFKLSEKVNFSLGDFFVAGTYVPFVFNIAYGALTIGSRSNNVTFSGGVIHSSFTDIPFPNGAAGVINFSTMQSFSRYVYLISENYYIPRSMAAGMTTQAFAGFTGLRFIQKQRDVSSFQLGVAYIYLDDGFFSQNFIPIPAISYTHKFGNKL